MSIKPALGWLGLLLFTTTAHAEGARELSPSRSSTSLTKAMATTVTRKTKGMPAVASSPRGSLALIESTERPRKDYEAEVYSGVPLDGAIAKERGVDKGLVTMVFAQQRRAGFRIAHDRIHHVVRFTDGSQTVTLLRTSTTASTSDHVDVLDTEDGVIVVDTTASNAGIFVTSDVYTFVKGASLEQRVGALGHLPSLARIRVREALLAAEHAGHDKSAAR